MKYNFPIDCCMHDAVLETTNSKTNGSMHFVETRKLVPKNNNAFTVYKNKFKNLIRMRKFTLSFRGLGMAASEKEYGNTKLIYQY